MLNTPMQAIGYGYMGLWSLQGACCARIAHLMPNYVPVIKIANGLC